MEGEEREPMLIHGGDIWGYIEKYGHEPLDFSANISPLGLPSGVRDAIDAALDHADVYPDPLCRQLRDKIAVTESVRFDAIVCGNGTADLLSRIGPALRPRKALICAPTFAEYEAGLVSCGCEIRRHPLSSDKGFVLDSSFTEAIVDGIDIVYICQPNNPTGRTCSPSFITEVLERCESIGARLVVDECFVPFLDDPESVSVRSLIREHPGLIVLKAFTKFFAMAGIRLGYALCSDEETVHKIQATGQPWAVSTLAQAAGIAALSEQVYTEELRRLIPQERAYLAQGLAREGISAYGEANFLFFGTDIECFDERLCEQGILIRNCSNYPGLDQGWYRVAVRTREENGKLLTAVHEVMAEPNGRRVGK